MQTHVEKIKQIISVHRKLETQKSHEHARKQIQQSGVHFRRYKRRMTSNSS